MGVLDMDSDMCKGSERRDQSTMDCYYIASDR